MSTSPQRERSDRPKVTRRLREPSPNEHRATARAIWQAQSDERVARAIPKSAPRHNKSDPTRTKCRDGCASTCQSFTKHRVHHENEHGKLKKKKNDVLPRSQPLFCRGLQSTAPATKNEPEASEVLHLPHGIIILSKIKIRQFHKTRFLTLSKRRPSSPNKYCACQATWPPKPPLILTHAWQRFSNVQQVPPLPRGWKSVRCPAPVTPTTF